MNQFMELMQDLMWQIPTSNLQMRELEIKWPEAFKDHDLIDPPTDRSSPDFMIRNIGWETYKLLALNYRLMFTAYNCLCKCLKWPAATQSDRDRRKEAALEFIQLVTALDDQVATLHKALDVLRQVGFPASIFGALE